MNGSQAGALGLVATLVLVSSLVALGVTNGSYQDRFGSISYSGNDGTLSWSGPWVEAGDDGGVTTGNVRVVSSGHCNPGNCVHIDAGLLVLSDRGVQRQADLAGAQSATLSFDYRRQQRLPATGFMAAQVRANGTSLWTTLETYSLNSSDSAPLHAELPIDTQSHATSQTQVRFVVLATSANADVYIDNVTIDVVFPDAASTTTSTTTTTLLPLTTTSLTLPILTTTTTLPITTTTSPSRTTTTAPAGGSTTTSLSASPGDAEEGAVDGSTVTAPVSEEELARAAEMGVVVGLEPPPSRNVEFALGLDPQQDLLVNFRSVVELIASEGVEALVLGTVIGFFAILGIKDRDQDEDEQAEDEDRATRAT